jgi:hypothetical protein
MPFRYIAVLIGNPEATAPGGPNDAVNHIAWTLGRRVAAGALDQRDVEDALYAAAARNGLVADDGARRCWATIRSGLGVGLHQPVDLDASGHWPGLGAARSGLTIRGTRQMSSGAGGPWR